MRPKPLRWPKQPGTCSPARPTSTCTSRSARRTSSDAYLDQRSDGRDTHRRLARRAQALFADCRLLLGLRSRVDVRALRTQRFELGPREVVTGPELLERLVAEVGEPVVEAEHVLAAHLAAVLAELRRASLGPRLPRRALPVSELLIARRAGEAGLQAVAAAEQRRGELRSAELLVEHRAVATVLEVRAREPQLDAPVDDVRGAAREWQRKLLVDLDVHRRVVGDPDLRRELFGEPCDHTGVVLDQRELLRGDLDARHRQDARASAVDAASASACASTVTSESSSISSLLKPAISRNLRASWIGFSSVSPRNPPRLNSLSTVRWNSSAFSRRSGSFSVSRRSQSEPIFTCVTSSASIQSSHAASTGSPEWSPKSFIVLNTSMARPSSARFTPVRRRSASSAHAAS